MAVKNEQDLYIQIKPDKIYPIVSIASIDPQTLQKTVDFFQKNDDEPIIKAMTYKGDVYILDGHYEFLAANILKREKVAVEMIDRNNIPFWNLDENIEDTLQAIGISALYDFEAIGGFSYEKYPKSYMKNYG